MKEEEILVLQDLLKNITFSAGFFVFCLFFIYFLIYLIGNSLWPITELLIIKKVY